MRAGSGKGGPTTTRSLSPRPRKLAHPLSTTLKLAASAATTSSSSSGSGSGSEANAHKLNRSILDLGAMEASTASAPRSQQPTAPSSAHEGDSDRQASPRERQADAAQVGTGPNHQSPLRAQGPA